jgi:hypothetical protein
MSRPGRRCKSKSGAGKNGGYHRSDPTTGEGQDQLAARAKQVEQARDLAMKKYHHFELASAAFQIAIVLASAAIITHRHDVAGVDIGSAGARRDWDQSDRGICAARIARAAGTLTRVGLDLQIISSQSGEREPATGEGAG